jgi:hypothetical protein
MSVPSGRLLKIENEVPFAHALYWQLKLEGQSLETLARDHRYELPYLAWETVRKARNPFFVKGTGFEGYFVGICESPEDALDEILRTGHEILDSIAKLYRPEYGFKSTLMKTLSRELDDPKAIHVWSTCLGATVARLRCNLFKNREADAFHTETYRIVSRLPAITYTEDNHAIRQSYVIEAESLDAGPAIQINAAMFKPSDQDAWQVAESIGLFGHPLVRQFLDRA